MTTATTALELTGRIPLPRCPDLVPAAAAERARDELTARRLARVVENLPVEVVGFDREWWDGQAHVACLVVCGGRRGRRMRVIETAGECVLVPYSRRLANRWLSARRRPRRAELGLVKRRGYLGPVVLDAAGDVTTCATRSCGALLPVGYEDACPVCGG